MAGGIYFSLSDGRTLFVERFGHAPPTVVFESAMGSSRNEWGAVAPVVGRRATAVVYDRSGLGRSPRDTSPRTLARLAGDLVELLGQLGPGPFVLVGHSWGGPIIRVLAAEHPDLVAGLVLVDQTDEGCDVFFSKAHARQGRLVQAVMPLMARLGLVRRGVKRLAARLPEPAASAMVAEDGTVDAVRTSLAEMASWRSDLERLRDRPLPVPDVPVTVISGMQPTRAERGQRTAVVAAHRARAAAAPQGRHVEAHGSGHYVPFTEPQLVVDEIERILDTLTDEEHIP
jgi:pimeloyl-ACP methyl ester carboxylesterase